MKTPQTMKERVELYFKHRHCLGRKAPSVKSGLLKFADYADKKGHAGPLTISLATVWATQFPNNTRASWTRRLWLVRGFAKYCKAIEPKTEIPPANFYGLPIRRPTPYIYSEKEMRKLERLSEMKILQEARLMRKRTRKLGRCGRLIAAMRNQFGGHAVKTRR